MMRGCRSLWLVVTVLAGCVGSLDRRRLDAGRTDVADTDGQMDVDAADADADVAADGDAEVDVEPPDDGGDGDVSGDAGPGAPVRSFNAAGGVMSNSAYRLEGTLGGPPGPGVSTNSEYRLESGTMRIGRGR